MPKSPIAVYGKYSDISLEIPRLDASTLAWKTIDYPHSEIHSGNHFFCKDAIILSINNYIDFQIVTPDLTKWGHWEVVFTTSSEFEYWLYEGVTINTPGIACVGIDRNRNTRNTAGITHAYIVNTSEANANIDTTVSGSLQMAHGMIGAGKQQGGQGSSRQELVLKQNTAYSLRFKAIAAGYIDWLADWYRHTDKK